MKVLKQPNKENREKTKTEIQELNQAHEYRVDYIRLILLLY